MTALAIYVIALCIGAEAGPMAGPIKELPPRDPAVVNGTADTKFSRDWWKVQYATFNKALDEKNTELVVSISRATADGGRYNLPTGHEILERAIGYLQEKPLDWQKELVALITAKAELAQYMPAANDHTKDYFAAEFLCAPYERAMVYARSGQYLLALQELERFYNDGRAERERLKNAPYHVPSACPLDEKDVLVTLIEMHLVLAIAGNTAADTAQRHFRAAFDYDRVLIEHAGVKQAFMWGNPKISDQFVKRVWTASYLALYLARQMHVSPSEYVQLAGETAKRLTGPEAYSLDDSAVGQEYLEAEGASEAQIWEFLQMYKEYFSTWPAGMEGFEYQNNALSRLQFAIRHKTISNAEAVIAELAGVKFADPALLQLFNGLQLAFQGMARSPAPELPMGGALDGIVKAMQADGAASPPREDEDVSTIEKAVSFARHNPVSLILLGITLACFIALIAMRIRRRLVRKG